MTVYDFSKHSQFNKTMTASSEDISAFVNAGNGSYRIDAEVSENQIIAMAQVIIGDRFKKYNKITDPTLLIDYLSINFGLLEREVFFTIFLDNLHHVINSEVIFLGTAGHVDIYPREIAKLIFKHNASAVIFAHNHPSGSWFSESDIKITKFLQTALSFFDVRILDHLVITGRKFISMKASGILE